MPELLPFEPGTPARKLLQLTRFPGHDAVLTIDGTEQRIVRLKVTPDITEILFEEADHA